jgi:ProP effector
MEQTKLSNQKETLEFLQQKYPMCFFAEGPVKPLKIGIFQDLVADLEGLEIISKRLLRTSLRHYTSSWRYLGAIKTGEARVNLQGEEGVPVEQQHADHASEQLKESKERAAAIREKNKEANKAKQSPSKHKGYVKGDKSDTLESADKEQQSQRASKSHRHAKARPPSSKNQQSRQQIAKPKPEELKVTAPLADTELTVGGAALVKLGKEPMPVVITEINKDGVFVQLKSGMTVRVKQADLFSPATK